MFSMLKTYAFVLFALLCPAGAAFAQQAADPLAFLLACLEDNDKSRVTILALRASGDKDLRPMFEALARSGDKKCRLLATATVSQMFDKEAAPILLERLEKDPDMTIRAEALVHLLELKVVTDSQLTAAMKVEDESVQCIAARALLNRGKGAEASETLRRLAQSKDQSTSCMCKVSLLGAGDKSLAPSLKKVMTDRSTSPELLALLLEQIAEEKIAAGGELAQAVIDSAHVPSLLKVRAYKALSALGDNYGPAMAQAIEASKDLIFQTHMIRTLAERADAGMALRQLAATNNAVGKLARYEIARREDLSQAGPAAAEVLAMGHPVVVDYVLMAAQTDIRKNKAQADTYTPALLDFIRSVPPNAQTMGPDHIRAANAARLLTDLASEQSMEGMRKILGEKYSAIARSAGLGLTKSDNATAACALAMPLLKSPYEELFSDAVLTLGHAGDKAAGEALDAIVAHPNQYPSPLVVLSCWYSLKVHGQTQAAAVQMAKKIR